MRGLGCGDPREIEIVGDQAAAGQNWNFVGPFKKMTFASRMQHQIYWGSAPQACRVVAQDRTRPLGLPRQCSVSRHVLVSGQRATGDARGPRERLGSALSSLGEDHARCARLSRGRRSPGPVSDGQDFGRWRPRSGSSGRASRRHLSSPTNVAGLPRTHSRSADQPAKVDSRGSP